MGFARLLLSSFLVIACAVAWAWSYRHNHTVLLCGLDGQINVARSQEGYLAVVVSRHALAPSDVGVVRFIEGVPDEVPAIVFGLLGRAPAAVPTRTWGPAGLNAVDYAIGPFAPFSNGVETFAAARLATATENDPADGSLRSVGILMSWAYPTIAVGIWFAFRLRRPLEHHRRKRDGLCLLCGYDLRDSPDGCPECGAGRTDVPNNMEKRPMRPIRNFAVVLVLMLAAFIAGRTISVPKPPNLSPDVDLQMTALADVRRDVRLDHVPLKQAVEQLADRYTCEIRLDEVSLKYAGIDPSTPVSFFGTDVTLRDVVKGLRPPTMRGDLGIGVRGKIVLLTTTESAARFSVTRVYDVDRILFMREAARSLGPLVPSTPIFDYAGPRTTNPSQRPVDEIFEDLICSNMGVGTWLSDGGQIGSFGYLDGYLVITQTPDIHIQIAAFLNDIYANDLKRLENREELRRLLEEKSK